MTSPDEYGKCARLATSMILDTAMSMGLTLEGLTDCVSDGSEEADGAFLHQTGENERSSLRRTRTTPPSIPITSIPTPQTDDAGFDRQSPKVTLYGTGTTAAKAEHYFTISETLPPAPSITTSSLPDGKVSEVRKSQTLIATAPSLSHGALVASRPVA